MRGFPIRLRSITITIRSPRALANFMNLIDVLDENEYEFLAARLQRDLRRAVNFRKGGRVCQRNKPKP